MLDNRAGHRRTTGPDIAEQQDRTLPYSRTVHCQTAGPLIAGQPRAAHCRTAGPYITVQQDRTLPDNRAVHCRTAGPYIAEQQGQTLPDRRTVHCRRARLVTDPVAGIISRPIRRLMTVVTRGGGGVCGGQSLGSARGSCAGSV